MKVSRMYVILFAVVLTSSSLLLTVLSLPTGPVLRLAVASANRAQPITSSSPYHGGMFVINNNQPAAMVYRAPILNHDRPMAWSPDGEWMVFQSAAEPGLQLYVAHGDGSQCRQLTTGSDFSYLPSWSPDGKWIAYLSVHDQRTDLYRIRSDGSGRQRIISDVNFTTMPNWSPDSRWLAVVLLRESNMDVYRIRADGTHLERLTDQPEFDGYPKWSPDGRGIAYISRHENQPYLYHMRPDGTDQHAVATLDQPSESPFSWSPDSRWMVFEGQHGDIYRVRRNGSGLQQLTFTVGRDWYPSWSPDAEWIAFLTSREDGFMTLYKMRSDGSDQQQVLEHPVAAAPIWSPTMIRRDTVRRLVLVGVGIGMLLALSARRFLYQRVGKRWVGVLIERGPTMN